VGGAVRFARKAHRKVDPGLPLHLRSCIEKLILTQGLKRRSRQLARRRAICLSFLADDLRFSAIGLEYLGDRTDGMKIVPAAIAVVRSPDHAIIGVLA
jgi:hypothetical protein